jgi:pyrroline-5-carboxylate reductase
MTERIAFIGGGNMASALISGLLQQGTPVDRLMVIEPSDAARSRLKQTFQIEALEASDDQLMQASTVIWAIKPQVFKEVAAGLAAWMGQALHISVAAGIRSDSIAAWLGTDRIVRAMPNTPALIGQGMCGLFARAGASAADREQAGRLMQSTGQFQWFEAEDQLDIVTALSGSGPAYVFYMMEAMTTAGVEMGLSREQASQLVIGTFVGASLLAQQSSEPPSVLRQQVTSKGGTTYAAITSMEQDDVRALMVNAVFAARERAHELGDEFGAA